MADAWIPLESNPDLLNAYAQKLGLPSHWQFSDVFSLDEADVKTLVKPRAFLLLYPCSDKTDAVKFCETETACSTQHATKCCATEPFFIRQHTKNACGSVALFHALANNVEELNCAADSPIRKFISDTAALSPSERGNRLGGHDGIRTLNDSVAQEGQTAAPDRNAEIDLHFVAVVRNGPCVYVLDGRREAPLCVCATPEANTISDEHFSLQAAAVAKKLMAADDSVNFNVMVLAAAQ